MAAIGGFRSDLSKTRKTDENFGNVNAGVLFSKVAYRSTKTVVSYAWSQVWIIASKGDLKYSRLNQSFHRGWIWSAIFPVCDLAIKELLPALHSSSKVQWLAHINPIPLFYKKILARIINSEIKNIAIAHFFIIFMSCRCLESWSSSRRVGL